jgi:hypothetical protein
MFVKVYYLPIILMKQNHPYRIMDSYEVQNNIMLDLRGYDDPSEIKYLLLPRSLHLSFRRVQCINNAMNG